MRRYRALFLILLVLGFAQAACNLPTAQSGRTLTAFPTFQVTPTFAPGQQTPTRMVNAPDCTYGVAFIGDVTIPDDTVIQPGTSFVKTWRVRNDGTCAWGPEGYPLHALAFTDGEQMSAPEVVPLPAAVAPGQTVDISVTMVAPIQPGTYTSQWKLRVDDAAGGDPSYLGLGRGKDEPLYTRIKVQ